MPGIPTLETYLLTTSTHGLIFAAAGFLDNVFAVWSRTPLFALVFAYFKIFLDGFVFSLDFFWAKLLDLFDREFFPAELLRARYTVYFLHRNQNFEVVRDTIDAEVMVAFQSKEVSRAVIFIANVAHLSRFTSLTGLSGRTIDVTQILDQGGTTIYYKRRIRVKKITVLQAWSVFRRVPRLWLSKTSICYLFFVYFNQWQPPSTLNRIGALWSFFL